MKRTILFLLLCAVAMAVWASDVLIFDPVSSPVPGRGVRYVRSANTTDFEGATNAVVNPVMPHLEASWLKVSNDVVWAFNAADSNAVASAQATAQATAFAAEELAAKGSASNILERLEADARLFRAVAKVMADLHNRTATNMTPALTPLTYDQIKTRLKQDIATQPDSTP